MKTYSFYDNASGLFRPFTIACAPSDLALNTPEGHTAIEGAHDHLCRRFDLARREIVSYRPPQPDADHEWNAATERWQKRADVRDREERRAVALNLIEALERQQMRPMRELHIDPHNVEAAQRLAGIEEQIVALRESLEGK